MHTRGTALRTLKRWLAGTAACLLLLAGGAAIASAQEILPNEFVAPPDGLNIVFGYYTYGHDTTFNIAGGPTIKGSGLEINVGVARYVHIDYILGQPAGFQIIEVFGSESDGHVGTARLGSAFGASNVALSAFFWPYVSVAKKEYFNVTGFIYPPIGTYDKNAAVNLASAQGSYGWVGDIQLGWDQGIGEHFSYDLGFDGRFYGDVTAPGGLRTKQDPDVRLQAWLNYNWTRAFQTSIGWESLLGGAATTNGFNNGNKTEEERLRAATSLFVAPTTQLLLQLDHDFVRVGGFKQDFGAQLRVLYAF